MEGEAESVWEGLPNTVYHLRTRGLLFMAPLTAGQTLLQWWMAFEGTEHGGILAVGRDQQIFAFPHCSSAPYTKPSP